MHHELDGILFAQMIREGAKNLERYVSKVDSLNVFPVPDGDTGTNMNLSFTSGVNEMNKLDTARISEVTRALSKGLLLGARGNSGVILSQLFRGFGTSVETYDNLNGKQFAAALQHGVETAYKAVMKPVEGTILTVAKDSAKAALRKSNQTGNITEIMEAVLDEAYQSLERTPNLLPILKEVGVVDSGGQGLVYVYEGFVAALKGEVTVSHDQGAEAAPIPPGQETIVDKTEHVHHEVTEMMAQGVLSVDEIKYGYCTEFIIRLDPEKQIDFHEESFRKQLAEWGDSLLVIADDELVKVHIHAEKLDQVMHLAQGYGGLMNIKIENMREQFLSVQASAPKRSEPVQSERKAIGIITVATGKGIAIILKSLQADVVIAGGQTMNPSTEDFVKGMNEIPAEEYIILPNNGNVIMAAEQAAEVMPQPTVVVPTKTIPQCLAALLNYNPTASLEQNQSSMSAVLDQVQSGQVTHAIRDTEMNGIHIKAGDFMGIIDGEIVVSDQHITSTTKRLLEKMIQDESEIVTLIYGEDISPDEVNELEQWVLESYDDVEVEIHSGEQPLYPYLIAVE